MNEYIVEIDELRDDAVVLVAREVRLLAFGRTLDEALNQARDSIRFRLRETGPQPNAVITLDRDSRHRSLPAAA